LVVEREERKRERERERGRARADYIITFFSSLIRMAWHGMV
jgi:hypothetical protein